MQKSFRCDDRAGFALEVQQSSDGDFFVRIIPVADDTDDAEEAELYKPCYGATVRIRTPMIGGGSHEALWHALASVFHPGKRIVPR